MKTLAAIPPPGCVRPAGDAPADPANAHRFRALDGLRAFAVAGVLVDHYFPRDLWFQSIFQWGQLGVQLFFVVSGFLITGILLEMRPGGNSPALKPALYTFYARRFLRICPPYYALLIIYAASGAVRFPHGAGWACPLYYFNFLALWTADPFEYLAHFWTLCIEEQFYLVWPLLILAMPRRWLAPVALALVVQAPFFRSWLLESGVPYNTLRNLPPSQLDFLAGGALLALMRWKQGAGSWLAFFEKWRLWIGLAGLGIYAVLLHWPQNPTQAMFNATGSVLMMTALVDWAAHGSEGMVRNWLACKPLAYLGRISYGIYLYQFLSLLVLYKIQHVLHDPRWLNSLAGFVFAATSITVLLAAGSYHFFERPLLRLKRWFPYHRERMNYEG